MRIRVSVASDFSPDYRFPKVYDVASSDPFAEVHYTCPAIFGQWFSLKIEFLNSLGLLIRRAELRRIGLEITPALPTTENVTRSDKMTL